MSLLDRMRGRSAAPSAQADAPAGAPRRVLVPAVDRHYSQRGLEVAFRLAQASGATVELVYVLEVPRILALEAKMPESEDFAQAVLEAAQTAAAAARARVEPFVQRARNPQDAILSLITQRGVDLLVLATRADEMRGLPHEMVRELFERAPCEVVVDYVPA